MTPEQTLADSGLRSWRSNMDRAGQILRLLYDCLEPADRLHDGASYKRPAVNLPPDYRATPDPAAEASSLANKQWWQVYQDPVLTQLIHTAIAKNYDVRIAATRVLGAQAQLGIIRANQFLPASVGAIFLLI